MKKFRQTALAVFFIALLSSSAWAAKTIADLTADSAVTGVELFECSDTGVSKKCTALQIKDYIAAGIDSLTFSNTGLHILDTNASHDLILAPGSNLTADRTFTLTTGDAARTLDISAANVTISSFGASLVDDAAASNARTTLGLAIGADVQAYSATLGSISALSGLTDNRLLRSDGTTGVYQQSGITIDDSDNVTGVTSISAGKLEVTGSTVPTLGWYTSATNTLAAAVNGTAEVTIGVSAMSPFTNDGNALGTTTRMWSDGFWASGAVHNWANGDVTLTHSSNALAFAGGTVSFDVAPTVGAAAVYYSGGTDVALADGGTGGSDKPTAHTNLGLRQEYCWAASDYNTTNLSAATGLATEYLPAAFTVTGVRAYVRTAPTGLLTIDINEGGTTILSTKLTIDSTEKTSGTAATAAVISDSSIAANAEITVDIDSTTNGKGLVVCMQGYF